MSSLDTSGGILSIDLTALVSNWRTLKSQLESADCGAALKADAYGIGAARAVVELSRAGCREFFVALIDEGISLRKVLAEAGLDGHIHILGGPMAPQAMTRHRLTPVLNSLSDIETWKNATPEFAADIHIDTGMSRLGLPPEELQVLANDQAAIKGLNISYVMSHLACAEDRETTMNDEQLQRFKQALKLFPGCKASLANSSGIYLGPGYHFDLARPGVSLYGVNPTPGKPNPMAPVIRLKGKILQVRDVDSPQSVGYGATHRVERKGRVATVGVGYADGYLRSLSNCGYGYLGQHRVPLVGRVSMDLITFDVSDVPQSEAHPGAMIDLIGPHNTIDDIAAAAGTIGYEILTALGNRLHRVYENADN
ncbi:MAG: alanine racemase [Rhodospirillaceae bacterium]|jgi:alanine racemase|nr:alanine racemase [Rhodospirillaceae bacterium]MBT5244233.1 alanine racemase [Rhodospirillaceae bacterium]MBT5561758.1 alanine racemase [Rhodospirillaceae bacterium]MBT6243197.1 alanine racemase [Rhodospirillaceae bacterium]MBT7136870.1 alanine racemase [Rhodospirillaceae bacterium]